MKTKLSLFLLMTTLVVGFLNASFNTYAAELDELYPDDIDYIEDEPEVIENSIETPQFEAQIEEEVLSEKSDAGNIVRDEEKTEEAVVEINESNSAIRDSTRVVIQKAYIQENAQSSAQYINCEEKDIEPRNAQLGSGLALSGLFVIIVRALRKR